MLPAPSRIGQARDVPSNSCPLVAAGEALLQSAVMDAPGAHVEVEVVDRGAGFGHLRRDP